MPTPPSVSRNQTAPNCFPGPLRPKTVLKVAAGLAVPGLHERRADNSWAAGSGTTAPATELRGAPARNRRSYDAY